MSDRRPSSTGDPLITDHEFRAVNGHRDDDECTHRSDGTDATYCGLPERAHARVSCDRCETGLALYVIRCYYGCSHAQCLGCAGQTEQERIDGVGYDWTATVTKGS